MRCSMKNRWRRLSLTYSGPLMEILGVPIIALMGPTSVFRRVRSDPIVPKTWLGVMILLVVSRFIELVKKAR